MPVRREMPYDKRLNFITSTFVLYGLAFLLIVFLNCGVRDNSTVDKKSNQDSIVRREEEISKEENDTFCTKEIARFNGNDFELQKFCNVFYSDSLSKHFVYLFTTEQIPGWCNFEKEDSSDLVYSRQGNSIELRILFLNKQRNNVLVLDNVSYNNEVIFLSIKEQRINDSKPMLDFMFEEVVCQIGLKKINNNLKIRYELK